MRSSVVDQRCPVCDDINIGLAGKLLRSSRAEVDRGLFYCLPPLMGIARLTPELFFAKNPFFELIATEERRNVGLMGVKSLADVHLSTLHSY